MTNSCVLVHFPHETIESDMKASSDVYAKIESSFNPSHSSTCPHDPSARVASLSTLDKEIDSAMKFVRSLRTRRNAFVPIFLLPTEILAQIFHLLVLEEWPLTGEGLGWIRVTHVCWHWRQVALDDSSLWARIWGVQNNTKWMSEMLARAKNMPLDLKFTTCPRSNREAFLMIPPQLSHTRQLCFHGLSLYGFNSVREMYNWEAPALEHLELKALSFDYPIVFRVLAGKMLFKGDVPRLRTISLSGVLIPWSHIPRGQLTELKIASPEEEDYLGELIQLIDLLVNCPALEILALDSCLPSQLITEFSHGQTIHLSHLSRLCLCGSTSRIVNMLKMLKLRSSTTLHLNCIPDVSTFHDDSEGPLLSAISTHFQTPAPIEFKSLTVIIRKQIRRSLNLIASTFPSTLRNRATQNIDDFVDNAELILSFDRPYKLGHSTGLLEQACKILPISSLEFISVSTSGKVDINWVELFSCSTNVTTMEVIGCGTSGLVRALTAPTDTNVGESTKVQPGSTVAHAHPAIFPKLKILGLIGLNFDFVVKGALPFLCIPFDVFERGLKQRITASGAPLKLLHVRDCFIRAKHVNAMKNLVQNFDSDFERDKGFVDRSEDSDGYDDYTNWW